MKWKFLLSLILSLLTSPLFAQPSAGITLSPALGSHADDPIHGYQIMGWYDPNCFHWRKFNLYFDAGFSHFSAKASQHEAPISIFAIAPVARYTFNSKNMFHPYIEISIGASYLNHTQFNQKNLGMHFAFQDRFGIGSTIGAQEKFSIGLHTVHYSNAHLSKHNSGLTVPVLLDVGYRFQ